MEAEVNLIFDDSEGSAGSGPEFRPVDQTDRRALDATNEDDFGDTEPVASFAELDE